MDKLTMWNLVIGFLSATFVLPAIQQPTWTSKTRALVTFVYSVLIGLGAAFFIGGFDFKDIAGSILTILVTAIATYKGFAQPTDIAPKIESATSPPSEHNPK